MADPGALHLTIEHELAETLQRASDQPPQQRTRDAQALLDALDLMLTAAALLPLDAGDEPALAVAPDTLRRCLRALSLMARIEWESPVPQLLLLFSDLPSRTQQYVRLLCQGSSSALGAGTPFARAAEPLCFLGTSAGLPSAASALRLASLLDDDSYRQDVAAQLQRLGTGLAAEQLQFLLWDRLVNDVKVVHQGSAPPAAAGLSWVHGVAPATPRSTDELRAAAVHYAQRATQVQPRRPLAWEMSAQGAFLRGDLLAASGAYLRASELACQAGSDYATAANAMWAWDVLAEHCRRTTGSTVPREGPLALAVQQCLTAVLQRGVPALRRCQRVLPGVLVEQLERFMHQLLARHAMAQEAPVLGSAAAVGHASDRGAHSGTAGESSAMGGSDRDSAVISSRSSSPAPEPAAAAAGNSSSAPAPAASGPSRASTPDLEAGWAGVSSAAAAGVEAHAVPAGCAEAATPAGAAEAAPAAPVVCAYCGTDEGVRFKCMRCRTAAAMYCSRLCQAADWPQHKQSCQPWKAAELRARRAAAAVGAAEA